MLPDSLPYSEDAEKALLSCFLYDPSLLKDAAASIHPDAFYKPGEKLLYEVLLQFQKEERPIEYAALSDYLGKEKLINKIGSHGTLAELLDFVSTPTHYPYYKGILLHNQVARGLILTAQDLSTAAMSRPEDLQGLVDRTVAQMQGLTGRLHGLSPAKAREARLAASVLAELDARRISLRNPPPKPEPIFWLNQQQISTAANLTVIAAQVKAGKTAVTGAMLAAALSGPDCITSPDCLGFSSRAHKGHAIIYFDTEQSPHDSWRQMDRVAKRADLSDIPENVRAYRLLDIPTPTRRRMLEMELARAAEVCGDIHCAIIDGVADLCLDPNDAEEAFSLVEELVQLAVRHSCPLVLVLHENPATASMGDMRKTRGHLGSQLERKAESNLRIVKGDDGISSLFSERCRNASISKGQAARFQWSEEEGMHVSVGVTAAESAIAKRREDHRQAVEAVFSGTTGGIPYGSLIERLNSILQIKGRTAERRIKIWQDIGIIKKSTSGYLAA